jgi:hypothetical protein
VSARNHKKPPPPSRHSLQQAEILLRRGHLRLAPDIAADQVLAVLARVLDRHDPFTTGHGRLLADALRVRTRKERRAGPRPAGEVAVRRLLTAGQAPWPRAVAAAAAQQQAHQQGRVQQAGRLAPVAERDGPQAAQAVIDHWREHGRRPSPVELSRAFGWPSHDVWALVYLLVEAGWLAIHRGELRPGPRARQPELAGQGAQGAPP